MKRAIAALGLSLLSGCPYDTSELQVADGGVVVPINGLDGGFFIPVAGSQSFRPLRAVPARDLLCMLVVGDYYDRTDYPKWIGSYIGDIRSKWWLGEPPQEGIYLGPQDASLRYTYQRPNTNLPEGTETVSIMLRFEKIPSFALQDGRGTRQVDGETHGTPLVDPYFLNDIQVQGDIDGSGKNFLDCWDWTQRESQVAPRTECPNCIRWGLDAYPCDQGQPEGFRLENCFK